MWNSNATIVELLFHLYQMERKISIFLAKTCFSVDQFILNSSNIAVNYRSVQCVKKKVWLPTIRLWHSYSAYCCSYSVNSKTADISCIFCLKQSSQCSAGEILGFDAVYIPYYQLPVQALKRTHFECFSAVFQYSGRMRWSWSWSYYRDNQKFKP